MKAVIPLALSLACALSLEAQITSTLNRLPQGVDEVRIRNNFAANVAAFGVTVKQGLRAPATSYAPLVVYSDPLIEPATKPLLPGEERVVITRSAPFLGLAKTPGQRPDRPLLEEPIVIAGIFADGSTTGDAALLTRLVLRRSNMLAAVETALETLLDAGRRNIPRAQLIGQFRTMAGSVRRWYLPPEQQVGGGVYQAIIGKLVNLPELQPGSPFPPATFVAEEAARLNRQRVTLLESQPSLEDATLVSTR